MRQLSLLDDTQLAGALPAIKAAMRGIAGAPEGEGRKALPDRLNTIARASGVKLTGGNTHSISEETLHKILSHLQTINAQQPNPKPLFLKIAPDLTREQVDDVIDDGAPDAPGSVGRAAWSSPAPFFSDEMRF